MHAPLHRTLIIRLSSIGDIVLSSLLVRTMRKRFPQSQVDFLVKTEYSDLVRHNPHISRLLEFPREGTFDDLSRLRKEIQSVEYDLIIDIHDSWRSRYLCFGAKRVVRINKRKLARFLLVKFKWNVYAQHGGAPSVAKRYLETVRHFSVEDDGEGLEVFVSDGDTQRAGEILRDAGISDGSVIIGVCPSAKHNNKMWLKEGFAEVGMGLSGGTGTVILFGSEPEAERCEEIRQMILKAGNRVSVINLAGKVSLLETAALMDRCSIIVTNDSGLMHIAAARKRPVAAIFGPTTRELGFFPFGTRSVVVEHPALSCRPCTHIGLSYCPKGHFKCMRDIAAAEVLNAAQTLLTH